MKLEDKKFILGILEKLDKIDYINPELQDYDNTRRNVSEKSRVGFGEVVNKNKIK